MKNIALFKSGLHANKQAIKVFYLVVLLALPLIAFSLVWTPVTQAATITVDTTADEFGAAGTGCALREAIQAANVNAAFGGCLAGAAGMDTINLPAGTFTLTIPGTGEDANATGDLDITDALTIVGNGARSTIVDANGIDRVFHIPTNVTVIFNNLTVQNGDVTAIMNAPGGGLYMENGTVTINDSRFTNNQSNDDGGAIQINTGTMTMNRSLIDNNATGGGATPDGGGIMVSPGPATVNVIQTTISNNSATNSGGAALVSSSGGIVTFSHTTITGNSSAGIGGLHMQAGTIRIQNTLVSGNGTFDCSGVTSFSYNIVGSNGNDHGCPSGGTTQTVPGATSTVINTSLANNGGPTDTHAVISTGSAFNTIPNGVNGCGTTYTVDQRGVSRPQVGSCDVGAFEYVAVAAGGAAGGLGPGGVGHTSGGTSLRLWLRSDRDVFTDVGCATAASNGNDVACWQDQSGNGFVYTQATGSDQPTFLTGAQNNQPAIQFNGTSDWLTSTAVLAGGDDTFSYFAAWQAIDNDNYQVLFEQNHNTLQAGRRAAFLLTPDNEYGFNGEANDFHNALPFVNGQYQVSTIVLNGAATNNVTVYGDGASATGTISMTIQDVSTAGGSAVGYKISVPSEYFNGQAAEIFVFSNALNSVERVLAENYLGAKYDRPIVVDVYDGDTGGNGDFDLDVAGIGQFGGAQHIQSHSAGIIVRNVDFLQDDGDWLMFGHRDFAPGDTTDDLPSGGDWATAPNPKRWLRHWYFDRTDVGTTGGTVNLIFDQSEGGMYHPDDVPAAPVSNYRLLGRSGDTGDFSDVTAASGAIVVINGDQIIFLGVDVSVLGSNFTVGTLNETNSPTAISLLDVASGEQSAAFIIAAVLVLLFGGITLFWIGRWNLLGREIG